jgi:hypothetical protein
MQYLLRRKITGIMLAFIAVPSIAFTQTFENLNLTDHDEKSFHFGINVGMNRSHYSFTHHPSFLLMDSVMVVESINSTGLNLAWLVNKRISDHFDFRTYPLNLTFTEKAFQYYLSHPDRPAGEDTITIRKIQGITMALPLQLKFSSDRINNFKVYMLAGVKFEYDMAANKGAKNAENLMKLQKLDYGVDAAIGFHLYFPVFVLTPELKLGWGLNNVHVRDPNLKFSSVIDKINARTISFSLTVE